MPAGINSRLAVLAVEVSTPEVPACWFCNAECRRCGKLGHIAKVCCSATAAVHNQPLESAVVTVNKSRGDQDIPPAFFKLFTYLN